MCVHMVWSVHCQVSSTGAAANQRQRRRESGFHLLTRKEAAGPFLYTLVLRPSFSDMLCQKAVVVWVW